MSTNIGHAFYIFIIFSLCCQHELVSALTLEIVPENFVENTVKELNITCIVNDPAYWAKDIVTMQIQKKDRRPIALLQKQEIIKGHNTKPNMQVEGQIHENANLSFLRLTINNPTIQDAGTYVCQTFYLDEWMMMKSEKASGNVTADQDIGSLVHFLMEKVSNLERIVQQQGQGDPERGSQLKNQQKDMKQQVLLFNQTLQEHGAIITDQRKQLDAQEVRIGDLQETFKSQTGAIANLQLKIRDQGKQLEHQGIALIQQKTKLQGQEKTIRRQDALMKNQSGTISELLMHIGDQRKQLEKYTLQLHEKTEKDSYTAAFVAGYKSEDTFLKGDTILFKAPIMNIGDAYNFTTGIFTAPRSGLYVFYLIVMVTKQEGWIYIDLKRNDKTMGTLQAHNINHSDQSFLSTVVLLRAGETIVPVADLTSADAVSLYDSGHFSRFSGFLLHQF